MLLRAPSAFASGSPPSKLESLYVVLSLLRFLPHILDAIDQPHLVMQFLLVFSLLDLQDFDAIMGDPDAVFRLD